MGGQRLDAAWRRTCARSRRSGFVSASIPWKYPSLCDTVACRGALQVLLERWSDSTADSNVGRSESESARLFELTARRSFETLESDAIQSKFNEFIRSYSVSSQVTIYFYNYFKTGFCQRSTLSFPPRFVAGKCTDRKPFMINLEARSFIHWSLFRKLQDEYWIQISDIHVCY